MKTKNIVLLFLFIVLIGYSCIEEFWPNVEKYENILVIEGIITNAAEPYYVRISRTSSLKDTVFKPVKEADVSILDQDDKEIVMYSEQPGIWQTSISDFIAETGHFYRLKVTLPDGNVYESVQEELLSSVNIDEVFGEVKNLPTKDPARDLNGFQFFINANAELADRNYYLWLVEHTYEYTADYRIVFYWDGIEDIIPVNNPDSLYRCWKTERVEEIFTAGLNSLTDKRIKNQKLHFIEGRSNIMRYGYSLLVKQYCLSKESFEYWDALKNQNTDVESLYATQPYQIIGNIRNISNPDEKVLGNFTVAGVTSKRTFFKAQKGLEYNLSLYCTPNPNWGAFLKPGRLTFLTVYEEGWGVITRPCFDCRYKGGILTPPDFWGQD